MGWHRDLPQDAKLGAAILTRQQGKWYVVLSVEAAFAETCGAGTVGIDLGRWVDRGLLRLWGERATAFGLEAHLSGIERLLDENEPTVAVLDAVGSLANVGAESEVTSAVVREVDMMKSRGITGILTSLTHDAQRESSSMAVSSVIG